MTTVADLEQRRADLIKKRESLVQRVRFGDKTVGYDLNQVNAALRRIEDEIDRAKGEKIKRVRFKTSSGW